MESTALSAAFERNGITRRDAEMQVALAKFQNNGGTYERLVDLARAAYGLPGEAPAERDGAGHSGRAEGGHADTARSVSDIRPSDAARVLQHLSVVPRKRTAEERMRTLRTAHGVTVKALMKIDGTDVRDYSVGQALSVARTKDSEAYVLRVLGMMYKHLPHTTRIGDIASDATIESVIRQSKEYANAAAA